MAKKYPSDDQDQYMVRFPAGMRDRIKDNATSNGRSMNAEIIKRLQDTLDYDEHVTRHAGAPETNEADYGLSGPGLLAKGAVDTILDELRSLRSSILDVRHLPDGRRQVEFAPATRHDNDSPVSEPEAFPAKDNPGYDEALLKQVQTIAARYGFDLVKKNSG